MTRKLWTKWSIRTRISLVLIVSLLQLPFTLSEAQFFDAFTADKRFFTGGKGGSGGGGGLFGSLGGVLGGSGNSGSGYGAPKPSYGTPQPSYGTPQPSYGTPKPSYNNKPSYNGPGLGGGLSFKNIELPVPDIPLPDPIEFKAGVLRSKGRIASGLLHAKAGILRAGANILAQKANALDKVAQAIPAVKAGLINTLRNVGGGDKGGFGLGGNNNGGYGAPNQQPSYGAPNQAQSYNAPSSGYGQTQPQVRPSYNGQNINVIPTSNNNNLPNNNLLNVGSTLNFGNNNNNNNQFSNQQQAPDSYGSPVGNPIGPTTNNNNGNQIRFQNQNQAIAPNQGYSTFNNNNQQQQQFNNNNQQQFNQQQQFNNNQQYNNQQQQQQQLQQLVINSQQQQANNNNQFSPVINNQLLSSNVDPNPAPLTFIGNDIANSNQLVNPFLSNPEKLLLEESRQSQTGNLINGQCQSTSILQTLLQDLFMGHEIIPDVVDRPPLYPLELTYKTIRTFPGMKLTADMTRFKPMLHWPAKNNALYTVIMSNLDINNRRNRTLSEFWHWFVANIPGDSVDAGEVVFEHLFPLVLPEGDGNHRFGYFVFEQPGALDYSEEGGPTDACSPNMSNGRGPFKSTKNFQKKYGLTLTAATFLIIDYSEASMEIACEWQKCIGDTINLVSPLKCGGRDNNLDANDDDY